MRHNEAPEPSEDDEKHIGLMLRSSQPIAQAWLDVAVLEERMAAQGITELESHVGQETCITILVHQDIEGEKAERVIGRISTVAKQLGMRPMAWRTE